MGGPKRASSAQSWTNWWLIKWIFLQSIDFVEWDGVYLLSLISQYGKWEQLRTKDGEESRNENS